MDPYKEMYYMLFNRITDVIKELQEIQAQAEALFMMREDTTDVTDD